MGQPEVGLASPKNRRAQRSMGSEDALTPPRRRALTVNTKDNRSSDGGGGRGSGNGEATAAEKEIEAEPLSPTARLFHQPQFNCYIIVMMGIGRRIDVDVVKAGLETSLVRHPRFSSVQVLDVSGDKKPRWVRTKVAVEDHLVVPELDPGGTASSPDQILEDYIASISTTTLDPSRPLWELHLLNLPTAAAAAVAVLHVHHSLGDGTSLMSLLLACTRKTSNPDSLPTLPATRTPSAAKRRLLPLVWAALVLAWHTLLDVLLFVATAVFLRDTATPLKGAEGVEFRRKRFVHATLSLNDVKAVKIAMGCTVNDVLIGITSAGLSRYLSRRYGDTDDGKKKKDLPANIRLRTTLLVNIRQTPGIPALAEMMERGSCGPKWGNHMGYVILPFPIIACEDPLDYVRRCKAIAERKKKSLESIFTYWCAKWMVKIFGIKATSALSNRVLCHTTLSFSNIIGPVEEIGFYGHPMVYIAPSVYGHPHAVTVHYQSYMDKMAMVLAVDELAVPDPHELLKDLAESLKLIKEAIPTGS